VFPELSVSAAAMSLVWTYRRIDPDEPVERIVDASTLAAIRDSKNPAGPTLRANLPALVTTLKATALPH
jgi:hypothetical protein